LDSPGPIKAWVNGAEAHAGKGGKAVVDVELKGGWNTLLFKTACPGGAWGPRARLTFPDGRIDWGMGSALPSAKTIPAGK